MANENKKGHSAWQAIALLCPLQILLLAGCLVGPAVAPQALTAQTRDFSDAKLIRGLRDRGMFLLAESHCRIELAKPGLSPTRQTTLVTELIQVQTARGNVLSGTDRQASWQAAEKTTDEFLGKYSSHPRRLLVEVQLALSYLSRAKLIRQEIAAEISPRSERDNALAELRQARSVMGRVEREIDKLIPERRGSRAEPEVLSYDQLLALKKNVRYQLAVCSLNQAQLYDPGDKLNRIDALNVVLTRLEEVRRESDSSQPIWWRLQIDRLKCFRALGQSNLAQELLQSLPTDEIPGEFLSPLFRERLLLAINTGDSVLATEFRDALKLPNRTPELLLAMIQSAQRLAVVATDPGVNKRWQDTAVKLSVQLENRHGAYWGRRGELVLIGANSDTGNGGSATGNLPAGNSNAEILITVGDQAMRKGNFKDAVRAYDQATAALAESNPERAFTTAYRAAKAVENLKEHGDAAQRMLELAEKMPEHESASTVHLLGCWNWARAMKGNPERAKQFESHLLQHLSRWPDASSANQASLWLAADQQTRGQWQKATASYFRVDPSSPFANTAAVQARVCAAAAIAETRKTSPRGADLQAAEWCTDFLRRSDAIPDWNDARANYLIGAAKIGFESDLPTAQFDVTKIQANLLAASQAVGQSGVALKSKNGSLAWLSVLSATTNKDPLPFIKQMGNDVAALRTGALGFKTQFGRIKDANARIVLARAQLQAVNQALQTNPTGSEQTFWQIQQADALRATGDNQRAMSVLQQLSKRLPKNARVQMELARAITVAGTAEAGITQWRRVAAKLKPNTDNWYESKLQIATLMESSGKAEDALKLLEFMRVTYPKGWNESKFRRELDQLLIRCQN